MKLKKNPDWTNYYNNTRGKHPSKLLQQALPLVLHRGHALDLGAGVLNDTRYLLENGFDSVVAVDKEDISNYVTSLSNDRLSFVQSAFDEFEFGESKFDLVHASWSLPFNPPETFNTVWQNIVSSIKLDGIYSGQLFGDNDSWSSDKKMTFHRRDEVLGMLREMQTITLLEKELYGVTANGESKHWHVFHIIARKIAV